MKKGYEVLLKVQQLSIDHPNFQTIEEVRYSKGQMEVQLAEQIKSEYQITDFDPEFIILQLTTIFNELYKIDIELVTATIEDFYVKDQAIALCNYANLHKVKTNEPIKSHLFADLINDFSHKYWQNAYEIEKIVRMLKNDEFKSINEFLTFIEGNYHHFVSKQQNQIESGYSLGLTKTEVERYAKPEFNAKQMGVIKHCLVEKCPEFVLNLITNRNYNSRQMFQIKMAYQDNLSEKQIVGLAKPIYPAEVMSIIRAGFKQKLEPKQIQKNIIVYQKIMRTKYLSSEQMNKIRFAFHVAMPLEKIIELANSKLNAEDMEILIYANLKKKTNAKADIVINVKNFASNKDFYLEVFKGQNTTSSKDEIIFENDQKKIVIQKGKRPTRNLCLKIRVYSPREIDLLWEKLITSQRVEITKPTWNSEYYSCIVLDDLNNQFEFYSY